MLHPSYTDLMQVVNKDVEEGETKVVNSRYSIVMATSKRARQLIDGEMPLVKAKKGEKPLSIAIQEMNEGKLTIVTDNAEKEE
ncbi:MULTISPECIES: DNA-directed RNA polymerase subunit omega [Clostridia]|jgi:DNA-directed RNA polymerase subunit omega|uniref:DNA-directed RNA polymerase subunit omega n=1 Tax=Clostridia TaxID=186801 RepID=UPI000E536355|nr:MULTISPECIES: DNA-directed RNA polymerase subunit omega [Clostridia]RGH40998.1 DNA-directed RNA polymerase subunit omega [Firmicutes bacterium AM41-5BH]RKQ30985.1 DNA-directed RNA polymerase subunit omega [Ruminococcus sp. B05]TAP34728.1 DNA-directed RNA polymerase subunit omega [Mediterraneibacter sp. gm002]